MLVVLFHLLYLKKKLIIFFKKMQLKKLQAFANAKQYVVEVRNWFPFTNRKLRSASTKFSTNK